MAAQLASEQDAYNIGGSGASYTLSFSTVDRQIPYTVPSYITYAAGSSSNLILILSILDDNNVDMYIDGNEFAPNTYHT